MTLEVERPHPDMAGMKQKGRVYVCDLAGTEPAGDIVFAKYEKKVFPNGDIEHKFIGAHEDDRKTKELQVCVAGFVAPFFLQGGLAKIFAHGSYLVLEVVEGFNISTRCFETYIIPGYFGQFTFAYFAGCGDDDVG